MNDRFADTLIWVLGSSGAVLLLWALCYDWVQLRVRKSVAGRRCPKCWYDLSHTVGLRCSECGFLAKRERQLGKARWRKRWAVLGVVLLLGCWPMGRYEDIKARGWVAVLPTTVLIALLPEAGSDEEASYSRRTGVWKENRFAVEMGVRMNAESVADWQLRWAIRRCQVLRTRERWPIDELLRVEVVCPTWFPGRAFFDSDLEDAASPWFGASSGNWMSGSPFGRYAEAGDWIVGKINLDTESVAIQVGSPNRWGIVTYWLAPEWGCDLSIPVQGVESIDEAITPIRNEETDRLMAAHIGGGFAFHNSGDLRTSIFVILRYPQPTERPIVENMALCWLIELIDETGMVVETMRPFESFDHRYGELFIVKTDRIRDRITGKKLPAHELSQWKIRISGDAETALSEFEFDQYWGGSFEYTLAELEWY